MKKTIITAGLFLGISLAMKAQDQTVNGNLQVNGRINGGVGAYTTNGVLDWNDVSNAKSGSGYTLLYNVNAANSPGGNYAYYHPFNFEYTSKNGTGNITQLAVPYGNESSINSGIWMRGRYSNNWSSWVKVLSENTSGNVGIGVTTPSYLLHLNNKNNPTIALGSLNTDTGGKSSLRFFAGIPGYGNGYSIVYNKTNLTDRLSFVDGGNVESISILNGGNVGIGTTSPKAKLDVNGVIQAGNKNSTKGGIFLAQKYGGNDYIGTLSSNYSSGALILGYGAAGMKDQGASGQLVSTFDNFSAKRSALRLNKGTLEFLSTPSAVQTTVGNELNVESRLYIDENGNVGMGTTTPGAKLDVNGVAKIKSTIKVDADGGSGYVASRMVLSSHNDYRGAGIFSKGQTNTWFIGNPYTDHANSFMIGVAPSTTNPLEKVAQKGHAKFFMNKNGNVGIGTDDPKGYKLAVAGEAGMIAEKVTIKLKANWPDFVFKKNYGLPTLAEVEQHIKEKGHLENIPSAKEVSEKGIELGEMNAKLLQKIEELTLYTIQQEKKIKAQEKEINKMKDLTNRLEKLEKLLQEKN